MPKINASVIRKLILDDNKLFIPERVTKVISQSIISDVGDISIEINRLVSLYRQYVKSEEPTPIDYSNEITLDAYVVHYLPRTTLIPKLLLLSLAYHPAFERINDELNILDLGSGTGGVALGLLDMFEKEPFSRIMTNIVSCEISPQALDRQKTLIKLAKYKHNDILYLCKDATDSSTYDKYILKYAPYDYIIAANLFAELSLSGIDVLLSNLPNILAPNGVLLVADPPRTHIDKVKIYTLNTLNKLGFNMYYPCPPEYVCLKTKCQWVWLDFNFECPDIEINDDLLETNKSLSTTWSIFCRSKYSIYDVLKDYDNELTWGVAVPIGKELSMEEKMDYSICTSEGVRKATHTRDKKFFRERSEVISRGSILGFNDDYTKVYNWHPLYGMT